MSSPVDASIDLREAFPVEKQLLTLVGYYPRRSPRLKHLFLLSCVITVSVAVSQFFSMLIQMIIDINDLSKVSETLFFFITHSTTLCKTINFLWYKDNMLEIEDVLARPVFWEFPEEGIKILKNRVKSAARVARNFRIMCVVAVFLYGFMPYLDESRKQSLPLSGWQPYNSTRHYLPTAAFQVVAVCYTATNNVNMDSLTWMLVAIVSAEFNVLKRNLERIDFTKEAREEFQNCVIHYRETVELVHKIESTFSKGIFLTFLSSVVVFCFTGFMMVLAPLFSLQFAFLAIYLSCMVGEVALYCWYGHDVMSTSDSIGESFYMSNWYECDQSLRKNVVIFLERTKRPVTLTGGKLVVLSLPTLSSILRSSYSYFAVLQQIYGDS